MTFQNPAYFLLLLLLLPLVLRHFLWNKRREAALPLATTQPYRHTPRSLRTALVHLPFVLRLLTLALVVCVLARPQTQDSFFKKETEGIDIIMAMDISTSMMTTDLPPNRMDAAKAVAYEFINNRPDDNIGLTLFGGEAFSLCPPTTDHAALLSMFPQITTQWQQSGTIASGTAIGMGLANAVAHLESSKAKSKVVILITDGMNNTGEISPIMAADMAREAKIRVYTIAIGSTSGKTKTAVALLPNGEEYMADVDNTADPSTLQEIARQTGGIFYQADTKSRLSEIYKDIDRLEKTKLQQINYDRHYEAYQLFGLLALISLAIEMLLRLTLLNRLP